MTFQEFAFISSLLRLLRSHFSEGGQSAVDVGRVSLASLQIWVRFRYVLFVFHLPRRNSYPKTHSSQRQSQTGKKGKPDYINAFQAFDPSILLPVQVT